MIIENIKLKLTLTLYKGKQRLRRWWPQVLENMTEIQTAHNSLADKVTEENDELAKAIKSEAETRESEDNKISEALGTAITEAAAEHKALSDAIETEAKTRKNADDEINYTKLRCFNYGNCSFNASGEATYVGIDKRLLDDLMVKGQLFSFTVVSGDYSEIKLPTNAINIRDYKPVMLTVRYPFREEHNYLAFYTGDAKGKVICDNGVFVDIEAEAAARENADDAIANGEMTITPKLGNGTKYGESGITGGLDWLTHITKYTSDNIPDYEYYDVTFNHGGMRLNFDLTMGKGDRIDIVDGALEVGGATIYLDEETYSGYESLADIAAAVKAANDALPTYATESRIFMSARHTE